MLDPWYTDQEDNLAYKTETNDGVCRGKGLVNYSKNLQTILLLLTIPWL